MTTDGTRRTAGEAVGSVTVGDLPLTGSVTYGAGRIVARFTLTAEGTRNQRVEAMTLTNRGSARNADLQNLSLENGRGRRVTPVMSRLDGEHICFLFDPPLVLTPHQTQVLQVRADVRASRRRTIKFLLEEASDLLVEEVRN
ncbi:MAG: hypothetical protein PHI23_01825 [Candidatus Peribacteraceae bacterium]|nr:hypothetical protein [Candidatus Peribacteraceae bacterium]